MLFRSNCNPWLASLLRGTVKMVDELVRVGTLVERDLTAAKSHWNQVQQDAAGKRLQISKTSWKGSDQNPAHTSVLQPAPSPVGMLTLPLIIRGQKVMAMVDTGSTHSMMQESLWEALKGKKEV